MPKYSLLEIERRWLVEPSKLGGLEHLPYRILTDMYIQGTQLRLRMQEDKGETVYKLCKKYGKSSKLSEPITNLYLSETEYNLMSKLPGNWLRKRRYSLEGGSLDVYERPNVDFIFFEKEFTSVNEALAYQPPGFVGLEVTGDPNYSGATIAT